MSRREEGKPFWNFHELSVVNHIGAAELHACWNQIVPKPDPLGQLSSRGLIGQKRIGPRLHDEPTPANGLERSTCAIAAFEDYRLHRGLGLGGEFADPMGCRQAGNAGPDYGNSLHSRTDAARPRQPPAADFPPLAWFGKEQPREALTTAGRAASRGNSRGTGL